MSDDGKIRLSKLMAERGICSRREADSLIERGLVLVNGEKITQLGTKVDPDVRITLEREGLREQNNLVTILLNKPIGYVSGQPEPDKIPAIRLLTPENQYKPGKRKLQQGDLKGIAVTGRLDIDSKGLLVFTQDGRIAKKIIGEDSETEKEYLVRVEGDITEKKIKLLCHGLELDGETLREARVERLNETQLRFVLREGKKRQIRRMCEFVELQVVGLKRVRVGKVMLGDLPEGMWRFLEKDEAF